MFAQVIVDISNDAVDKIFDYVALPETQIGMRVKVPFAGRSVLGYVIALKNETSVEKTKIKTIEKNLESVPKLRPEILSLCLFLARHFFLRLTDAIKLALPSCIRLNSGHEKLTFSVVSNTDLETGINILGKRAKSQLSAFVFVCEHGEVEMSSLLKHYNSAIVRALIDKGLLVKNSKREYRLNNSIEKIFTKNVLTNLQKSAKEKMINQDKTFLLKGVTGSGKTEVYMSIIEDVLIQNKTAIMLVPEISLTPQMMQRFISRFGNQVAVLHSGLTEGERFDEWDRIFTNQAKIVLGARSALFAPLTNLGAIIIDEEHDGSYSSETNPRYNAHEVAEFRARYNHCPLILGSATPSLDSYAKTLTGEYELVELPERINGLKMPNVDVVDMIAEVMNGNTSAYSRRLLSGLDNCISHKKQAIVFINRRGYASFVVCRNCGYRAKCDDCEVSLVYHKEDEQLKCHFCGKRYKMLTNCPNCKSSDIRFGALGTEKVCADLKRMYPDVPIFRMDNDTTRGRDGHKKILEQFASSSPSILVGTQMISKGHDYPNVSFVGILDADVSLFNSDYKANERTFQLVTQVAGRAGRKTEDGAVVLQTYAPNHYVYRYASKYDFDGFFEKEINLRQTTMFPPYTTIIRILVSSQFEDKAQKIIKQIFENAQQLKTKYPRQIVFMQAMASPVKRIQAKFRYQVLARYFPNDEITSDFFKICDIIEKDVSIFIEINPNNLR